VTINSVEVVWFIGLLNQLQYKAIQVYK